jgi:hypothetical protein
LLLYLRAFPSPLFQLLLAMSHGQNQWADAIAAARTVEELPKRGQRDSMVQWGSG